MGTLAAYLLVVGGILMILLGGWLLRRGALPDRVVRTDARPSARQVSLLLAATGVSAVVSQLPVILGAAAGTKLLLWFASVPFLVVALVLLIRVASSRRGPHDG
ncbi:hypothetical protein ABT023_06745 [Micromonospora sp. NPDC002296]|uniref:hypothetical protein n=1 Tax=Micromonospora sp. NPDC002296 TaxID=3154271 RepID=UPI0033292BAD